MIHVEKIKIVGNSYPGSQALEKGFEIVCDNVNLLVGDQGCGKSTLLTLLQKSHKDIEISLSEHVLKKGVNTFYFDSERDNPRMKDPQMFTDASGRSKGIGYGGALASRFQSHGEVLESFIIGPLKKAKNSVIFLDEPESGLSLTNQYRMIDAICKAVDGGCQLFIATHCFPLIECFNVISLEHNEQMSGVEFINKIKSK